MSESKSRRGGHGGVSGRDASEVRVKGAWSNQFLNQKSWHPLSQKNQQRLEDAERKHRESEQRKRQREIELEKESEKLRTASLQCRTAREREVAEGKLGLSFMYTQPPGLSDEKKREEKNRDKGDKGAEKEKEKEQRNGGGSGKGSNQVRQGREPIWKINQQARDREESTTGRVLVSDDSKYELVYRNEIRGGFDPSSSNQQILIEPDDEGGEDLEVLDKRKRKHRHHSRSNKSSHRHHHHRKHRRRSHRSDG